jgi:magnesium transporter
MPDQHRRTHGRCLFAATLISACLAGCSEELGPEQFTTTTVRGVVRVAGRPVPGGWVELSPAHGTRGNLRSARIGPDGTFRAEKVAVGAILLGFDNLRVGAIPGPDGPVPPYEFRLNRSPIRRDVPDRPEVELVIDLLDEVARSSAKKRRGNRRKRNRGVRRPSTATTLVAPDAPTASTMELGQHVPRIRVIYRDGTGAIHVDWPPERIAEAVGDPDGTAWIDVEDLEAASSASVEALFRNIFRFHPLAIEDALKDTHVPKLDDWGAYLYMVVDTVEVQPHASDIQLHELDLFLGSNYLLTYHNEATEVLEQHRRQLLREPENRLKHGSGHLLYRLMDDIVADLLLAIERLDDEIDAAQDEVFHDPTPTTLQRILQVKRCALRMHRTILPMREVLNRLARDAYDQVLPEHRVYFRDVYDHLVRIHDIIESLRDLVAGALDIYLSVVSNRTNETMKTLTLVTVMFLPMSFLAGFFGMNFFGDTLMFVAPVLPKATIFWSMCVLMFGTPVAMAILAHRRGWF